MSHKNSKINLNDHQKLEPAVFSKANFRFCISCFFIASILLFMYFIMKSQDNRPPNEPTPVPPPSKDDISENELKKSQQNIRLLEQELLDLKEQFKRINESKVITEKNSNTVPNEDQLKKIELEKLVRQEKIKILAEQEAKTERRLYEAEKVKLRQLKVEILGLEVESERLQENFLEINLTKEQLQKEAKVLALTNNQNNLLTLKNKWLLEFAPIKIGDRITILSRGVEFSGVFHGITGNYIRLDLLKIYAPDHEDIVRRASPPALQQHLRYKENLYNESIELESIKVLLKSPKYVDLEEQSQKLATLIKKLKKRILKKISESESLQFRLEELSPFYGSD